MGVFFDSFESEAEKKKGSNRKKKALKKNTHKQRMDTKEIRGTCISSAWSALAALRRPELPHRIHSSVPSAWGPSIQHIWPPSAPWPASRPVRMWLAFACSWPASPTCSSRRANRFVCQPAGTASFGNGALSRAPTVTEDKCIFY